MRKFAISLGFVTSLILAAFVIVAAINAVDDPLSPAALAFIEESQRPSNPSKGYDYLMGFTAAADANPLTAGREIREQTRTLYDSIERIGPDRKKALQITTRSKRCDGKESHPAYCGKGWYLKNADAIETLTKENEILLARFDQLTTFDSLSTDPKSKSLNDTTAMDVYEILRIKQDTWGLKWAQGDDQNVMKEWLQSNQFFNRWLEAPQSSLVEVMIVLHALEVQKQFATELIESDPKAKAQFKKEVLLTLKPTVTFEELKKRVAVSEFNVLYLGTRKHPTLDSIHLASISEPGRLWTMFGKLPLPLFKRNATLNAFVEHTHKIQDAPCVTDESSCKPLSSSSSDSAFSLINPIGKGFVTLSSPSPTFYEKLYLQYSNLRGV